MTLDDAPDDPTASDLGRALAGALPQDDSQGACPTAEVLAGWAEGRLPEATRPSVERHLAACALCRAIAVGLGGPGAPAPPTQTPAPPPAGAARGAGAARLWLALGIAVLLGLGLWWWWSRSGGAGAPTPHAPPADFDADFAAAARLVAQARPDLLGGFTPLDRATLETARAEAQRGGIEVVGPRETVLSVRPRFRWLASGRAQVHTLALRGEDGKEVWSRRIEGVGAEFPADAPALARGTAWQWSVRARRATGPVEGSLGFRVASEDEARHYEESLRVVRERAPAAVAGLLAAHVALRAGLLEEAEALLAAAAPRAPLPALEQATRAYVRARLGLPAAR